VSRQRGVALVLVLAVTGVLALLILQVGLTARQQVAQAQQLGNRAEAQLRLHSREAALLYSLLTRERNADPREAAGDNPYTARWNFRGEPFEVDGSTVRIQDMAGLLPMPIPGASTGDFAALLVAIGIDRQRAEQAARALRESFLGSDRVPLQSLEELGVIAGLSSAEIDQLEDVATLYPVTALNPGTASEEVLAVKYTGTALEGVIAVRRQGALDERRLQSLTGDLLDDTMTTFLVGPGFRLDITIDYLGVRLRRQSIWTIRPTNEATPLELWSYRSLDPTADMPPASTP
jgi:hypothetical protein